MDSYGTLLRTPPLEVAGVKAFRVEISGAAASECQAAFPDRHPGCWQSEGNNQAPSPPIFVTAEYRGEGVLLHLYVPSCYL
eukprot:221125-Pelagomonas_calceolata.AAC.6